VDLSAISAVDSSLDGSTIERTKYLQLTGQQQQQQPQSEAATSSSSGSSSGGGGGSALAGATKVESSQWQLLKKTQAAAAAKPKVSLSYGNMGIDISHLTNIEVRGPDDWLFG